MCANETRSSVIEILKKMDVEGMTIGEVIIIKNLLELTNSEAINIFLGA